MPLAANHRAPYSAEPQGRLGIKLMLRLVVLVRVQDLWTDEVLLHDVRLTDTTLSAAFILHLGGSDPSVKSHDLN